MGIKQDVSYSALPRTIDDALIQNGFSYISHLIDRDVKLFGGNSEANRDLIYSHDRKMHREREDNIRNVMQTNGWLEADNNGYESAYTWLQDQIATPNQKQDLLARYYWQETLEMRIKQLPFDDYAREQEQKNQCQVFTESSNSRFLANDTTIETRIDVLNYIFTKVFNDSFVKLTTGKKGLKTAILDLKELGKLSIAVDPIHYLAARPPDIGVQYDNLPGSGLVLAWE